MSGALYLINSYFCTVCIFIRTLRFGVDPVFPKTYPGEEKAKHGIATSTSNQQSDVLKGLKMRELLDNDLKIQVGFKKNIYKKKQKL